MARKKKGGRDKKLFRDRNIGPECSNEQYIVQLSDTDIFPDYTGNCIFIKDNMSIEEIPIFPDTVKYVALINNPEIEELFDNQFPEHLTELHIEYMDYLTELYLPKFLARLTIENMPFTLFRTLPKYLVTLKIIGCSDVDFDYNELPDNLLSLEFEYCRFIDKKNIISILSKYKRNHPQCDIQTDFEFIPTKAVDLNKNLKAYNIMELEEIQITQFLADNKNFIVGKCFNQFVFIDKAQLEQDRLDTSSDNFKLSSLGFGINNSFINIKHIDHILESYHKFWLFEKIENQYSVETTMFTLIKLKDANSLRENLIRKFIKKTLKKKNNIIDKTRKKTDSKSKSKSKSKTKELTEEEIRLRNSETSNTFAALRLEMERRLQNK
jgi:hypothetical protein